MKKSTISILIIIAVVLVGYFAYSGNKNESKSPTAEAGFFSQEVDKNTPLAKPSEIVELKNHPWFVAVQYHPEFKSKPIAPLGRERSVPFEWQR